MSLGSETHAPSDLSQIGVVTRYELHKHIRSRRIVGILVIEALVIVLLLAVPPLTGHPYSNDPAGFISNFTQFTGILVIIGAVLFAGDAIVSEFQSRTGYLILPNPVNRSSFFFGKVLASMIIMAVVISVYYAVAIVSALAATGGTTVLSVYSYLLALLYGAAAIGIGYLISALMKGATAALVLTFAVLLLIFPVLGAVSSVANSKPVWSVYFCSETITDIMQTPYPHDVVMHVGANLTVPVYAPDVPTSIGVMLVYVVVTLAAALVTFRRKELLG
ncbi:MAG TPA: ABC transporter permease [Methanomassiliicoccales archaeon]|nr:ABC transporter permease [Methanomassiliicoccales archaeon]